MAVVAKSRSGKPVTRPQAVEAPTPAAAAQYDSPVIAREVARPPMPTIPGRVVALNRAGQPIQRVTAASGVNQFALPAHLPPAGWSWEFKAEKVLGEARTEHIAEMMRAGWEYVKYEDYPGVFAPQLDDTGGIRKGPVRMLNQVLMERPIELTLEANRDDKRRADERVGTAKAQYRAGPDTKGTSTAVYDDSARAASYIRQSTEQVNLPPNPGRQSVD